MIDAEATFQPIDLAATQLGVPVKWLRDEALAGRIPCLRAGRRLLVNAQAIEQVLIERARQGEGGGDAK